MGLKVPSIQTILGLCDHTNTVCKEGKFYVQFYSFFLLKEHKRSRYLAKTPQPWVGRVALSGNTTQMVRIRVHNSLKCLQGEKSASGRICYPRCEVRVNSQSRQKRGINNKQEKPPCVR